MGCCENFNQDSESVINRWKNRQKENKVLAIFLDFRTAFETIDRDILLKKNYINMEFEV